MDAHELTALHAHLIAWREQIKQEIALGRDASAVVTLDQVAVGRVSRIDALAQQQIAIAHQNQRTVQIRQIEGALERMAQGVYGVCYVCQEEIEVARLHANPIATRCVVCLES